MISVAIGMNLTQKPPWNQTSGLKKRMVPLHRDRFCWVLRMLTSLLNASVDSELATGGISSISECHDHVSCGSSGEGKMGAHESTPLPSFTSMVPMKVLQHSFMCTALASVMNRTVCTWCCSI